MKKIIFRIMLAMSLLTLLQITACSSGDDSVVSSMDQEYLDKIITGDNDVKGDLSEAVKESLVFMREEEKLARDVYLALNETYNLRVFKNISKSEQAHMNAIKFLLDSYNIEDPVGEDVRGIFQNTNLQELYTSLIEKGNSTENEALEVGAMIEEIDILDLRESLANVNDNWDVTKAYTNLEKASQAHLRAFVFNLKVRGVTYTPQYLDQAAYNEIINK